MNKEIEELFVKKFVIKDKRERVLQELFSKKKRRQVIDRLYMKLDPKYEICCIDKPIENFVAEVNKVIKDFDKECYVFYCDDAEFMPFRTAFEKLLNDEGVIVIFYSDSIVVAKDELWNSAPSKSVFIHN